MPAASRPLLVALSASPRRQGASAKLLGAFLAGVRGWRVLRRSLPALGVLPCQGCQACRRTGRCWQKDRMAGFLALCLRADALVLSSPVFFYGFPSQAKAVIDRTQPLWLHPPRRIEDRRPAVFLATCASPRPSQFAAIVLEAKAWLHTLGFAYSAQLLVPGLEGPLAGRRLQRALRRARALGRRCAAPGFAHG